MTSDDQMWLPTTDTPTAADELIRLRELRELVVAYHDARRAADVGPAWKAIEAWVRKDRGE